MAMMFMKALFTTIRLPASLTGASPLQTKNLYGRP